MLAAPHSPVMTAEVVKALDPSEDSVLVDATFGRGGHTRVLLDRLGAKGRVYAMDRDPEACAIARDWAQGERRLRVVHAPFSKLSDELHAAGIAGQVSGIVLDLGVSSPQLDDPGRGFSFMRDGPLDMRMDPSQGAPVQDWLATVSEENLVDVLRRFGEERYARRIARAIVDARNEAPLTTTGELSSLVDACVPTREPESIPPPGPFKRFGYSSIRNSQNWTRSCRRRLRCLSQAVVWSLSVFILLRTDGLKDSFTTPPRQTPFRQIFLSELMRFHQSSCGRQNPNDRLPMRWRATRVPAARFCVGHKKRPAVVHEVDRIFKCDLAGLSALRGGGTTPEPA